MESEIGVRLGQPSLRFGDGKLEVIRAKLDEDIPLADFSFFSGVDRQDGPTQLAPDGHLGPGPGDDSPFGDDPDG